MQIEEDEVMRKQLAVIFMLAAPMFVAALAAPMTGRATSLQLQPAASSARVDPLLQWLLSTRLPGAKAPAVITYDHQPNATDFARLSSLGITKGFALRQLPMVIADVSLTQLSSLRNRAGVLSIWSNRVMKPLTNTSRSFIGVSKLMADREVTARNSSNPGLPISGKGVGIGYIDTGIDGTQQDLETGTKTVQNVIQPLAHGVVSDAGLVLGIGISISDLIAGTGFVPPIYIENVPTSDIESGHGTHGAGVAAGTGASSSGFYGGVATGARLVGVDAGDDKGLPLVAILGAYDYLFVNQFTYNIRVINNSWGSSLDPTELDPLNPVNVATRRAHDHNVTVVFAAGNAGSDESAINPYSTMPWTISVAAGEKQGLGTPAEFSSRGLDDGGNPDVAGMPADPAAPANLRPDLTAPGVAIVSVRAHGASPLMNAIGVLNGDPLSIPPAFLPNYLSSQGTSFACPHVSGVVALLIEAEPTLTPDEVVTILRQTATPMPYAERVVGAGYLDAHNAVRKAMGLAPIDHPANLIPQPGGPEITDVPDDQLGTRAQDILACDFAYDSSAQQIIYTLTLADLSGRTANNQWTASSDFGDVTVFVSAAITETGTPSFEYGRFTTLPNGTRNQESIGPVDAGEIIGNRIIMKLAVSKVSAAAGASVVGTISKRTQASAQILVGSSLTGGLLLNGDSAGGSDFEVSDASQSNDTNNTPPAPVFTERLVGSLAAGPGSAEFVVGIERAVLDAKLNYNPANQNLTLELLDVSGNVIAVADQSNDRRIRLSNLALGTYRFRVRGSPTRPVDFVIKGQQGA
jgi:serine protease AprX